MGEGCFVNEDPTEQFSLEHLREMFKFATERHEHYGVEIEVLKQRIEYLEEQNKTLFRGVK